MSECADCPKASAAARQRWVAPKRDVTLSGILIVDKPPGMTSHDVVDEVRRMTGQRKVGHAGTLDPMATGVLIVCLGQATRVAEYLMAGRKRYRATIVLGTSTDTYDAEGEISDSNGRIDFTVAEIDEALAQFVGCIEQVPPMYSAVKRHGTPLYKLARQGRIVERGPRQVEIDAIELLDWSSPTLVAEVTCAPGTYIRSLAHDLGQCLGSGAHLAALVRLSSGRFGLEDAVSLARLDEAFQHGQEDRYLLPVDEALLDWPAIIVSAEDGRRIAQGQSIQADPPGGRENGDGLCRAYSLDGDFLAIMTYHAPSQRWRPRKVFAAKTGSARNMGG
jgi:tRNA pseudouridine55 synthase